VPYFFSKKIPDTGRSASSGTFIWGLFGRFLLDFFLYGPCVTKVKSPTLSIWKQRLKWFQKRKCFESNDWKKIHRFT
jgi:hypothetical protein